jgi:hypothetical protein
MASIAQEYPYLLKIDQNEKDSQMFEVESGGRTTTITVEDANKLTQTINQMVTGMAKSLGGKPVERARAGSSLHPVARRWQLVKDQAIEVGTAALFPPAMKDLLEALKEKQTKVRCIFQPEAPFRFCWDLFMALIVIYSATCAVYRICFDAPAQDGWLALEYCIDCMFAIDIMVNFNTAYYNGRVLITSHPKIARNYLRGWLVVDAISTIPFDLIFNQESLRVIKLLKLVRLFKIIKFAQKIEDEGTVGPVVLQLTTLTMMTTFLAHILACLWFYFSVEAAEEQKLQLLAVGVEPIMYGDNANVKSWVYG